MARRPERFGLQTCRFAS